jgi:predicted DNA binding protein
MVLFTVSFSLEHTCPYADLSRRFPLSKMFIWTTGEGHEVIEVTSRSQDEYSAIRKELAKLKGHLDVSPNTRRLRAVAPRCPCSMEANVTRNIDARNMLLLPPVTYEAGKEHYRIVVFRHRDLRNLFNSLNRNGAKIQVTRKEKLSGSIAGYVTVSTYDLFSRLTEKQAEALLASFRMGYYHLPRKADLSTIASKVRVPRTTFAEHLKKAENKLMQSIVPSLELFRDTGAMRSNLSLGFGQRSGVLGS